MIYLDIINDLNNKESYLHFINGLIKKANENTDEELRLELIRVYKNKQGMLSFYSINFNQI